MTTSNLHKAAVVLLSLPREQTAQLLDRLDPERAAAVAAEMTRLREIDRVEQEEAVREFAAASAAHAGQRQPAPSTPFRFLHDLQTDALLDLLADEHPQTISLILSYLPPRQTAAVLAELTPDQQLSVVCRIATMSAANQEVVRDVEKGLQRRLRGAIGRATGNRGMASVVKMLNVMEPAAERRLLGDLAEANPQLGREIRRAMFGVDVAACEELNVAEATG